MQRFKQEEIDDNQRIVDYSKDVEKLTDEKDRLQVQVEQLNKEIFEKNKANQAEKSSLQLKNRKEISDLELELNKLAHDLQNKTEDMSRKTKMENELKYYEEAIQREKLDGKVRINMQERERILAIQKLRSEMLYKIKETKANLLALNDEQLQTTTRLTILQNHQLSSELEHQSKQTEELLEKNKQLNMEMEKIKRDIAIHKELETELAKRSHFCQKVIQKLKAQAEALEAEKASLPEVTGQRVGGDTTEGQVNAQGADEEMINFLELKLENIEKQLKQTQAHYEQLHSDYSALQEKLSEGTEKYKRAALLMSEFLHDILEDRSNILTDASTLQQSVIQS